TIAVCRELWTNENPSFSGKYAKFSNIFFQPRPVQKRVPIWVGGESGPAMRRTARLGDAWYPIGTNPRNRLDTLKRLEAGIERLKGMAREAGRNPSEVGVSYRFSQFGKAIPERADNGDRRLGSGDNAAITADLRSLRDLGVGAVDVNFDGATADAVIDNMRRFREDVLAKV
ncbi:MAG TPA: LLM class flavin-dependent oxidoreductase, partial [Stellaceae bacterium]|nr:LLM class flavin-dependent oxidoreductase [Stellaceae bacterium]